MPAINLADSEFQSAAMAAGAAGVIAEADASKQSNPTVRATFETMARKYQELAEKLESARRAGSPN